MSDKGIYRLISFTVGNLAPEEGGGASPTRAACAGTRGNRAIEGRHGQVCPSLDNEVLDDTSMLVAGLCISLTWPSKVI